MKIDELPGKTRAFIVRRANERGLTPEQVIGHFSALSNQRGTSLRNVFTDGAPDAARIARWRVCIGKEVERVRTCEGSETSYLPIDELERIEGAAAVDIVLRRLCKERGAGGPSGSRTTRQRTHHGIDDTFETARPSQRAAHDRDLCRKAAEHVLGASALWGLDREAVRAFVRKFYRAGDGSITPAVRRALLASIGKGV